MPGGKSNRLQGARPQWDVVRGMLHMRLKDVAAELDVSITYLRRLCRRNGFPKWPGKQVRLIHFKLSSSTNVLFRIGVASIISSCLTRLELPLFVDLWRHTDPLHERYKEERRLAMGWVGRSFSAGQDHGGQEEGGGRHDWDPSTSCESSSWPRTYHFKLDRQGWIVLQQRAQLVCQYVLSSV